MTPPRDALTEQGDPTPLVLLLTRQGRDDLPRAFRMIMMMMPTPKDTMRVRMGVIVSVTTTSMRVCVQCRGRGRAIPTRFLLTTGLIEPTPRS